MNLQLIRKAAPYVLAVSAVLLVLFLAYRHGVNTTDTAWQAKWDKQAAQLATARADAERLARQAERDSAQAMATIDNAYQQGKADAKAEYDRVIADLRAGNVRLRERFKCPAANDLPGAGTSTGGSDAAEARGLQRDDAEFLIREAERADAVVRQLQACQAIVNKDRGQ